MPTWKEFHNLLPSAATFSKDPRAFGFSEDSNGLIISGEGAYFKDEIGKSYLDWISGLGGNLLGHKNPIWLDTITRTLASGVAFSLPTYSEFDAANLLINHCQEYVPGWRNTHLQTRFLKTGSEALDAAVRLARAATGRKHIINVGYHGWHDTFVSATPPAHGILPGISDFTQTCKWDQVLEKISVPSKPLAAVVIEFGLEDPSPNWIKDLVRLCFDQGILLIVDEVVTGFRYAKGGVCQLYGIEPDIVCYGKALSNGMSISAIVAPKNLMSWFARNDPVFVSSTACGNPADLAGISATLTILRKEPVVQHIWDIGEQLKEALGRLSQKYPVMQIIGHLPRSLMDFSDDPKGSREMRRGFVIQYLYNQGILMNRPNFPTYAHVANDVNITKQKLSTALGRLKRVEEKGDLEACMKGQIPQLLFHNR